jgi:DNA polymerase III delta prime subunit
MATEQFLWVEKYRPRTIDDCILPADIKNTAKSFVAQGDLPNMILAGGPGMGKTTLAMAMCRELGTTPMFLNGSEETGIDTVRTKIKDFAAALSFDGKRRYIVLDEADYLNPNSTQPALRALMEEFAINCGFILTCNYGNRIIPALHSRCTSISFAIPTTEKKALMVQTLQRLQSILTQEQVTASEDLLIQVIKRWWPDLRRMINETQRACIDGVLTPAVLGQHADVQFEALWKAIASKNYKDARAWIGQYSDIDPPKFYRAVFDWLHDHAEPNCLPTLIVQTADYQYRHLNAVDPQVHLAAYCLEMMHNGQYK